jgi:hypothetical protein
MSEVRDVLEAAAPTSIPRFDGAGVARRARRLRRRRRATVAGLSSVVVAVAGLVLSLAADRDDQQVQIVDTPDDADASDELTVLPMDGVGDVVLADGSLWMVGVYGPEEDRPADNRSLEFIARRDPTSGRVVGERISADGPIWQLASGLGLVWAMGGGDGSEPDGFIMAVDPRTDAVVASMWFPGDGPGWIDFADGRAWVTLSGRVVGLDPSRREFDPIEIAVGGDPGRIVATSPDVLWYQDFADKTIARLDVPARRVTAREQWPGLLLAPGPDDTIWATEREDGGRLVQLTPGLLSVGQSVAVGVRIDVDTRMVRADDDGLWVVSTDALLRYSRDGTLLARTAVDERDVYGVTGTSTTLWATLFACADVCSDDVTSSMLVWRPRVLA